MNSIPGFGAKNNGSSLTVAALAAAKKLPAEFLRQLGLEDTPQGVEISYLDEAGIEIAKKKRTALKAKDGSYWPAGMSLSAYGRWRLEAARKAALLYLVEGESDCWTLWHHDLPVLGLPGSNAVKTLTTEVVEGIDRLYVVREPDKGGEAFVPGIAARLSELGWKGNAYVLTMPEGLKDISDLHCRFPSKADFLRELEKRDSCRTMLEIPAPNRNGKDHTKGMTPAPTGEADIDDMPLPPPAPWPTLPQEALHGLAGEIVETIAPETESDPLAILGQVLVAFGSAVGRTAHFLVEGCPHYANLYLVLVGESSRGRKGTSRGRVMQLMRLADKLWTDNRVMSGLSSGEGLIWAVRDQIEQSQPIKKGGKVTGYQMVMTDEGVADKRLLVDESEFAQALKVMQREGNTLSPVIRHAWETGSLRTLTKNSPARATGAHISISAHVTMHELVKLMKDTEAFNGFANRFLWLCVRRSKLLPDGGRALDLSAYGALLYGALESAKGIGEMQRDENARALWHEVYPRLTEDRGGFFGAVTGRAEAQVLRLSMLYALLDGKGCIEEAHLQAALALWGCAELSAKIVFGQVEQSLADEVLAKLREAPSGLTRSQLRDTFQRNVESKKLLAALAALRDRGLAHCEQEKTGGRPAERWRVRENAKTRKASQEGQDTALSRNRVTASDHNDEDGYIEI